MYPDLKSYIQTIKDGASDISEERKSKLTQLTKYIRDKRDSSDSAEITFICTHNSRRSHLCQIWSAVMADYFELDTVETFSGGTEATAFNPRAVAAIERSGFKVENSAGENPRYKVYYDDEKESLICFSKIFGDSYNPQQNFAAVMTCLDADKNCPFVPGAENRFSIPYKDPKEADDTPQEAETYDKRCRQIAIEMYYIMSKV